MKHLRLIALVGALAAAAAAPTHAAETGQAAQCSRIRNDDTIRPYDPSLRTGLLKAYSKLFPGAPTTPDDAALQAGTNIRCMNGRLLACFVGANLPCGKLNASRENAGADEFCRSNPDADFVPAFAVGHDTAFRFRCTAGQPRIVGTTYAPDSRGFARTLWSPLD